MSHLHAQFVLFDGFDPLDVIAPYEILTAAQSLVDTAFDVEFVSAEGPRVVRSGVPGISLTSTGVLDPTAPGYILIPGAAGPVDSDQPDGDPIDGVDTIPTLLSRFASSAAVPLIQQCLDNFAITVTTVCGGSLGLAMAGLIGGRNATTHVLGMDLLDAFGVTAVRARVVDDGNLISAGGLTSGLDLGLYLLERDFGADIALAIEKFFEHERRGTTWKNTAVAVGTPQ